MKLKAINYTSPILTEGKFDNVFIEETSFELKRNDSYFRINFEMYYLIGQERVVLEKAYLAFQGMNNDANSSNETATFQFNDSEEIHGLIEYLEKNNGAFPENFTMVNWGFPSFEDALSYLIGGSFESPEIHPANEFVKNWIKNKIAMKGEFIGKQFEFVV